MKNIGYSKCPYCHKGINPIRLWSLKNHGEYMCPRCKGISNIYLSPLIYVLAAITISASIMIYFVEVNVWNAISYMTPIKVFIPYAIFYLCSIFLIYFKKPVIKRVRKTSDGKYFDQDGNEMKMRMGKLVPANSILSKFRNK